MKYWLGVAGVIVLAAVSWPASAQSSASEFFASRVPRWFPVPKVPVDNPLTAAKVELGRFLFYDPQLSGNGTFSCASCHQQALAFTDGLARAVGSTGGAHPRSSMSLANVVYNASFGWDDRRWSLESQMEVPMYNEHPVEMGLKGNETEVLERFVVDRAYNERFRAAFPGETSPVTLTEHRPGDRLVRAGARVRGLRIRSLSLQGRSPRDVAGRKARRLALFLRSPEMQRMSRQRQYFRSDDVHRHDAVRS